jgi:putative transposase
MKPYSQDLREKVMAAVAAGKQSNRAMAETFGISESTIEKWTRRVRETGSVAASAHAGGIERVLAPHGDFLRTAVNAQPDITLDELCERVAKALKLAVSASMVSRELTRLNLPRKKRVSTTASGTRRA